MPRYSLCYIEGSCTCLRSSHHTEVEAPSFQDALATRTAWPVEESYDHKSASAKNPGTCTYYHELWEASCLPDKQ